MKNTIAILTSLVLFSAFFSCSRNAEKSSEATSDSVSADSAKAMAPAALAPGKVASYAVPYSTAVQGVTDYVSLCQGKFGTDPFPRAFAIRSVTLLEAMGAPEGTTTENEYIRGYIGMDDKGDFQFYLTPAKDVSLPGNPGGEDVIPDGEFVPGPYNPGDPTTTGKFLWDFAHPCPNQCAPTPNDLLPNY
jgi:hypothetical protein